MVYFSIWFEEFAKPGRQQESYEGRLVQVIAG